METTTIPQHLDLVLDVHVDFIVQLGSTRLPMKELLSLKPGCIVQLDQKVQDPVQLLIHDKLVGFGEVVVVDDHLGIKITEIIAAKK